MLDRAAPDRHKIRFLLNPTFHPIERALIHEPVNGALISRRTLLFDLASLAGGRSVTDRPISGMLALGIHGFTSRAADRVGLLVMDELHGAEVLRAHGPALDRRCHADARSEEHTSELQSLMRI